MSAPSSDELRADFVQLLWAYIETTQSGVMEWPPQAPESQSTPVKPSDEKQILWDIAAHAFSLRDSLGAAGGQPS